MSSQALPAGALDARTPSERRARRLAIAMMCVTMAGYTFTDSSAKFLGAHLPVWQIVWSRYVGATLVALLLANPIAQPARLRTVRPKLQLLRSLFLLASTLLSFIAVRALPLADMTAINFALPLAVALGAGPVLGERVGPRRLTAILVGFAGVLVVVRPWNGALKPAMVLCLCNVVVMAGYNMLTRLVAHRDHSLTTLIYSTLVGAIVLTPLMIFVWVKPDSLTTWIVFLGIGLAGACSHWLLIVAHARAPASILAPFIYTQLLWSTLVGVLAFGDVPSWQTLVGAGIVIVSGLYLWRRERG